MPLNYFLALTFVSQNWGDDGTSFEPFLFMRHNLIEHVLIILYCQLDISELGNPKPIQFRWSCCSYQRASRYNYWRDWFIATASIPKGLHEVAQFTIHYASMDFFYWLDMVLFTNEPWLIWEYLVDWKIMSKFAPRKQKCESRTTTIFEILREHTVRLSYKRKITIAIHSHAHN